MSRLLHLLQVCSSTPGYAVPDPSAIPAFAGTGEEVVSQQAGCVRWLIQRSGRHWTSVGHLFLLLLSQYLLAVYSSYQQQLSQQFWFFRHFTHQPTESVLSLICNMPALFTETSVRVWQHSDAVGYWAIAIVSKHYLVKEPLE